MTARLQIHENAVAALSYRWRAVTLAARLP
jgi:hypothetical protein